MGETLIHRICFPYVLYSEQNSIIYHTENYNTLILTELLDLMNIFFVKINYNNIIMKNIYFFKKSVLTK